MTKDTEYYTGQQEERYSELLKPLKQLRIDDMMNLLIVLRLEARELTYLDPDYREITARYKDVEEAIQFWKGL